MASSMSSVTRRSPISSGVMNPGLWRRSRIQTISPDQCSAPIRTTGNSWDFASLDECEGFKEFVKGAETRGGEAGPQYPGCCVAGIVLAGACGSEDSNCLPDPAREQMKSGSDFCGDPFHPGRVLGLVCKCCEQFFIGHFHDSPAPACGRN